MAPSGVAMCTSTRHPKGGGLSVATNRPVRESSFCQKTRNVPRSAKSASTRS